MLQQNRRISDIRQDRWVSGLKSVADHDLRMRVSLMCPTAAHTKGAA